MSTQRGNKNSDAIRILQRDRDASARATHLKAEIGMVPNSTIERKIMSTKTSIKRIALVAAAALTLGGFSAVSANAAAPGTTTPFYVSTADSAQYAKDGTVGAATETAGGVAGPYNYVVLTAGSSLAAGATLGLAVSGVNGTVSVTHQGATAGVDTLTVSGSSVTSNTNAINTAAIKILTPTVGNITVVVSALVDSSGTVSTTTLQTITITVGSAATSGTYSAATSSAYIAAGETNTASADAVVTKQKTYTATDSATASIIVSYLDVNSAAIRETLTATIISGPGALAKSVIPANASGTGTAFNQDSKYLAWDSRTVLPGSNLKAYANGPQASDSVNNYSSSLYTDGNGNVGFYVFANGAAGVSTIAIKNAAGTVIATKTLTFTGTDVSSIAITTLKGSVNGDAGARTSEVISAVLKDSSGNLVTGLAWAPTVTYSVATLGTLSQNSGASGQPDTTTSTTSGVVTYGWNAPTALYGPVTVTLTDPTTKATASATITIASQIASTVSVAAPTADLGNTFSYTVTLKDANGYAIPDGIAASNYISSVTSNGGIGSPDLTAKVAAGVITLKVTGPIVPISAGTGAFLLTGTAGTANSYLVKTLTGTTVTASFSVNGITGDSSSLAYDAASAATDAANNAYEEAQNATQAASDALAAVKALAVQVKALIALVNKIKAKLKA